MLVSRSLVLVLLIVALFACDSSSPGRVAPDASTLGCGNEILEKEEVCDDGVRNGLAGFCLKDCSGFPNACGDGDLHAGYEVCDHGERNGSYGHCLTDCSGFGPHCGDGNKAQEEACDDGDNNGKPGFCQVDCTGETLPWHGRAISEVDTSGATCEPADWLSKYMRYRLRLRGDGSTAYPGFVTVDDGPGGSVPAARREKHTSCASYWGFAECPHENIPNRHGIYLWGDGTVWLGLYLSVLSTEYAALSDMGLDTAQTESDLYSALMALNRIDESADVIYGAEPARDGYFLRDDVPPDFATLNDGTPRWLRDDGTEGYECASTSLSCKLPSTDSGAFTSLDQVVHLTHGLALVARLVPDQVVVNGSGLAPTAREMIHRMVLHLKSNNWRVTDPNGEHPSDDWGGNAIGMSNQLAKTANAICGNEFGVEDYRNFASRVKGTAAWLGLDAIWNVTFNYNRTMGLQMAAATADWSSEKVVRRALADGKDYYAMTYALIHGVELPGEFSDWRIESVLDSADCEGPCRGYAECGEGTGWKAENRIDNPGDSTGSRHFPKGEFNGLDYMALHNVYYLYRHGRIGTIAPEPTGSCEGFLGLRTLLSSSTEGDRYETFDECVATDFGEHFCGRPWASWLEDAYRGKLSIFTNGLRWECSSGSACVLLPSNGYSAGDDLILGSPNDDELRGGAGNDCIVGFAGNDELKGGQGYDTLEGGAGDDMLFGENSGIVLSGDRDRLFGGPGEDYLKGGPGLDELYGGDGNDDLFGDGGDDQLVGGDGDDELHGNEGDDRLTGGDGDDSLIGGSGDDVIWGDAGRDKIDGGSGGDTCDGGDGDDFLRGGTGDDYLIARDGGEDRVCGNGGDDTLVGSKNDHCLGGRRFLGGTDVVLGCQDRTARGSDCNNAAFSDW